MPPLIQKSLNLQYDSSVEEQHTLELRENRRGKKLRDARNGKRELLKGFEKVKQILCEQRLQGCEMTLRFSRWTSGLEEEFFYCYTRPKVFLRAIRDELHKDLSFLNI